MAERRERHPAVYKGLPGPVVADHGDGYSKWLLREGSVRRAGLDTNSEIDRQLPNAFTCGALRTVPALD